MLQYPTISKTVVDVPVYAFDKLDGSNIRVEWTPKNGFHKFGTRTRLLDPGEEPLGEAVELFHAKHADALHRVLKKLRTPRVVLFCEFHGDASFAGNHASEPHRLTFFDASVYKKGFLPPNEFVNVFADHVPTADMLYHGKPNRDFLTLVRSGTLPGMTFEGVVCKSVEVRKGRLVYFKVKNEAWLEALRMVCGDDNAKFERLA